MPKCPFATWRPISGSSGPHVGGPFKIVHHTTEGSSAEGAMSAFSKNRSDPHFTVDATTIFQHIDTAEGARALRNDPGGVQTNRDSAIQIELVGFAHLPKDGRALTNLARLCRWIESTHGVPGTWPAGPPKPAKNGKDPGGHNRDPIVWDSQGGHYGHCHVPENSHWDPAYSEAEVTFIMDAAFDAHGRLTSSPPPASAAKAARGKPTRNARATSPKSTMPDHDVVPVGISAYIRDLRLPRIEPTPGVPSSRSGAHPAKATTRSLRSAVTTPPADAKVDVGSLISFVDGLSEQEKDDVLYSVQLAQRGASGAFDRFTQTRSWYQAYCEILENLGWATEQFAFTHFDQSEGEFRMDQAALAIITAIATQNQLAVLQQSVAALAKLTEEDNTIRLFDFHSSLEGSGNFQLGSAQRASNGAISMAIGAFYYRGVDDRRRFLFFKWGSNQVNFWSAAQRMTFNSHFYARRRDEVIAKLDADAPKFISSLNLGAR
ncbi:N-acetylmuramoyl-L-alanine amidase [Variovorax sp. J31P179]|uniref:N-acetylmuramoyl-L-alanine amidase n=1 Tax=Variovorax sp. J31P179 TaxID=3053508 RepID=UPI00257628FD|nr:N-acetylmuramoyl-L-alanine amidase [Variovorax sp. J31P179]MDM0085723.1 N-acetylmuramoyl-L-alanine amidase [Variovorax sp. J31P179]